MHTLELPPLARPAFKPIMCRDQVIAIGQYYGTPEQSEIVFHALANFGHLIRYQGVRGITLRLDFSEFAAQIEANFSVDFKVQEILRVLREVHSLNSRKPLPAESTVAADETLCATQAA